MRLLYKSALYQTNNPVISCKIIIYKHSYSEILYSSPQKTIFFFVNHVRNVLLNSVKVKIYYNHFTKKVLLWSNKKIKAMKHFKILSLIMFAVILSNNPSNAQVYDFNSLFNGASGALANGWNCQPSTAASYRWQAETAAAPGLFTGPGSAYEGSTYMVVNSAQATGATVPADLISPQLNVTSYTNPAFTFWYHINGASYGFFTVEVSTNGTTWTVLDSIQAPTHYSEEQRWHFKSYDLSSYSSAATQIRFRSEANQASRGAVAVDLCSFVEQPGEDAGFNRVGVNFPYYKMPLSQVDSITPQADISNYGFNNNSQIGFTSSFSTSASGPVSLSTATNSLGSFASGNFSTSLGYVPSGPDSINIEYILDSNPADTFAANDTMNHIFHVTDSTYSRDGGEFAGGIGFTGLAGGRFGQTFTIYNVDTITSVDVRLQTPTQGDSIRIFLYNTANGLPTTLIDSSDVLEIPASTADWYNVNFSCEVELTPGDYFFAVEQINTNNLGFGFTQEYYEPNVCFYQVAPPTWTAFEIAGFQVVLGIRPNFGVPRGNAFTVELGSDTNYCSAEGINLSADAYVFGAEYLWSTNDTTPTLAVDTAGTYIVTVSKCGVSTSDTLTVSEIPTPDVDLGGDDYYCSDTTFSLTFNSSTPQADYTWSTGDSTAQLTIDTAGQYWVTADFNGCTAADTVIITRVPVLDPINLGNDTGFCEGDPINLILDAGNFGADFSWQDNSSTRTFIVSEAGIYSVTVAQGGLCPDTIADTITVIESPFPDISLNDTFFCTGSNPLILNPGANYDAYSWNTGDTTPTIEVTAGGNFFVTVANEYGCESTAGAEIESRPGISLNLGPDIADTNTSVTLAIQGNFASFLWSTNETTRSITVDSTGTYWAIVTSTNSCTASDTLNVDIHYYDDTSVGENELPHVKLYPNPAHDKIYFENGGEQGIYELSLFSATGALVKQQKSRVVQSGREEIQVGDLVPGIYFLKVQTSSKSGVFKMIIK